MRLLYIIICWIIQPRTGGFDIVTERDLVIMYHVVKYIPLNLLRMIIKVMQEAVARIQTFLPYAMILKYYGVRFQGEKSTKLGEGALHKMH